MAKKTSSTKASKKTTTKKVEPVVETPVVENTVTTEVAEDNYDQEFATVLERAHCCPDYAKVSNDYCPSARKACCP